MDCYKLLEVERNASTDSIKCAYRKKVIQFHPDKNRAPNAANRFKEVHLAYMTLIDPVKRSQYDAKNPIKTKNPSKDIWGKLIPSEDQNHGHFSDGVPPSTDIWGNPLTPEQKEEWIANNRRDVRTKPLAPKPSR